MTEVQISREGRLLRLALNRPERRNALNMDLCTALAAALERSGKRRGHGRRPAQRQWQIVLRRHGPARSAVAPGGATSTKCTNASYRPESA